MRARSARSSRTLLGVLVVGIALLMILRELHLDITPILTGAGIAGLAVGFGAQSLVKDVISGFFLILENQVRVGDVAAINGTSGLVEATPCGPSSCATQPARCTSFRTAASPRCRT